MTQEKENLSKCHNLLLGIFLDHEENQNVYHENRTNKRTNGKHFSNYQEILVLRSRNISS